MAITLLRTRSDDERFLALHRQLTALLAELNGESDAFYAAQNRPETLPIAVLAFDGEQPVGCGALRPHGEREVEIKRMFVAPSHRGRGIAAAVLDELLRIARELHYRRAVLETSRRLTSAVRLYQRAGFHPITNYEPYVDLDDSLCMALALAP